MKDFRALPDLASERLGGRVVAANDEFFAPKKNLLKESKPIFIEGKFTSRGKWMDGWETRRRRTPGHDWCIVRLGLPGIIRGVVVDTSFFRGNFPSHCSIEACAIPGKHSSKSCLLYTSIRKGQTLAVGQVVHEEIDMSELLERALKLSDYRAKRERFARENPTQSIKRGIGFASFLHGAGFTGSGEEYLASVADVEATPEGRVRVYAASTEMGQGTNTIFSQIAADALGLDYADIEVMQPDTAQVPNSGPTVASRTCMIVGKLVETAAIGIKQSLQQHGFLQDGYDRQAFVAACRRYHDEVGPLRATSRYSPPPNIHWDEHLYRGDAYGAYGWAVYVAEVSVDTATYETRVEDFVAVQEVGRVINPVLAAGQVEGGVAQGIGFALYEKVVWQEGRMINNQMTNYIMPTSMDLPPIRVYFEELPYARGPAGAKGIGELPLDGTAAAIMNAIENATGICIRRIPMTPEDLTAAFEATRENAIA